jgi:hypothetical protein
MKKMKRISFQHALGVIAVIAASCGVAQADVMYTSQASWNGAVSGATTINFEGIVPPSGFQSYAGSTTVGGVQFGIGPASPSGLLFVIGDNFYGFGVATVSSQDPGTGVNPTNDLLITLPNPVTALAFNFIVDPGNVTITLSDGTVQSLTAANTPTSLFFGVTASGGISSVDITEPFSAAAESINLSDFSYGSATFAPTPEPGAFLLFGTVLAVCLGKIARRCRQRSPINDGAC